jgi:alkanesulfonate monooxygenase SsuD/methylene tetrahydromethanopterin reductase-like flavin-dependent oxidoreductase (luciferase family)
MGASVPEVDCGTITGMPDLSFGVYVIPRGPEHGRDLTLRMEDTDFDVAWVGDTLGDWRDRSSPLLDPWVTLGALASETEDLELGMMVTNLAWRDPVHVARFAMTVDQLSNGRFTLGLGCGQVDDQLMVGRKTYEMPNKERVDRLEEGTRVIDRLLRQDTTDFNGQFTQYENAAMAPGCVQKPRLPLALAGNGPRITKMAARLADTWNAWIDITDIDQWHRQISERTLMLDDYLVEIGREPASLTRSLLAFDEAFDAWSDPGAVPRLVEQFAPLGFTEFIFYPPGPGEWKKFLKVGVDVLGSLRS